MVKKIQQKIVGMAVVRDNESPLPDLEQMREKQEHVERSAELQAFTYKISTPHCEHALDVIISDIILNPGTQHELRRPFEICINSKNMDDVQWIVVLFRLISAIFRRGGDITFVVEELRGALDSSAEHGKKGEHDVPSLAAEIGDILETHLKQIGMLGREVNEDSHCAFPLSSEMCGKCRANAVVYLDGCMTCLSCGDSKCG